MATIRALIDQLRKNLIDADTAAMLVGRLFDLADELDNASEYDRENILEREFLAVYDDDDDDPTSVQAWDGEKFVSMHSPSVDERASSADTSMVAPYTLCDENDETLISLWFAPELGRMKEIKYFASYDVARDFAIYHLLGDYETDDNPFPLEEVYINNAYSNSVEGGTLEDYGVDE